MSIYRRKFKSLYLFKSYFSRFRKCSIVMVHPYLNHRRETNYCGNFITSLFLMVSNKQLIYDMYLWTRVPLEMFKIIPNTTILYINYKLHWNKSHKFAYLIFRTISYVCNMFISSCIMMEISNLGDVWVEWRDLSGIFIYLLIQHFIFG